MTRYFSAETDRGVFIAKCDKYEDLAKYMLAWSHYVSLSYQDCQLI